MVCFLHSFAAYSSVSSAFSWALAASKTQFLLEKLRVEFAGKKFLQCIRHDLHEIVLEIASSFSGVKYMVVG